MTEGRAYCGDDIMNKGHNQTSETRDRVGDCSRDLEYMDSMILTELSLCYERTIRLSELECQTSMSN